MEIKLNIAKKHLYILMAFVLAVVGLGLVIAFNTESPETFGHSAGEMMVTINGAQKTLQTAIDDGSFGGGSRTAIFTSSGTFTAPAGVTRVYLTMVGGGGGGSGGGGSGGGGGATKINYPYTVVPGSDYSVTVGAGGAGGVGWTGGSAGGTTSFDTVSSDFGDGGGYDITAGGNDDIIPYGITGGRLSFKGQGSLKGGPVSGGGYGSGGGGTYFGTGGTGGIMGNPGNAGTGYGAGGGGGSYVIAGNVPYNGGAGTAGLVIVMW